MPSVALMSCGSPEHAHNFANDSCDDLQQVDSGNEFTQRRLVSRQTVQVQVLRSSFQGFGILKLLKAFGLVASSFWLRFRGPLV